MMRRFLISVIFLIGTYSFSQAQNSACRINDYELDVNLDYQKSKLYASCGLTLENGSSEQVDGLHLILYRLLKVTSVTVGGESIPYKQEIRSFEDWDVFQVNYLQISLTNPISIGASEKIVINYEGTLLGYDETGLSYVKDNIRPEFTILRPDCLAYPVLGKPEFSTLKEIAKQNFNYQLIVTVPDSLYVVNGGILSEKSFNHDLVTFTYKSIRPTYQIVTTISKYEILNTNKISTYYFEKDSSEATRVHAIMLTALELYSKWWGELKGTGNFSLIEIPENYGSQATEDYIIQTASAFNQPNQIRQLYHEISHLWNVKPKDKHPPRWNEGLATFVEYLTVEKIEDVKVLDSMAREYCRSVKSNDKYGEVALIDYGKENVTGRSYKVGFLFFYLLHKIIGEYQFNDIIKSYYDEYWQTGATTDQFVQHIEQNTAIDLDHFFDEWIYTTNYIKYLKEGVSLTEFVNRYKSQ